MRILVIGAGAVGGYFGGKLVKAGRDVAFLVREGRARRLRETGLVVLSPGEDFTVTPKLVTAGELRARPETYDVVLLSTKAYQLEAAMEDFAPAVGESTAILPLLNGMSHLDTLSARFGAEKVLGGSTRISSDVDEQGRVVSMDATLHDLHYGELSGARTARIEGIDSVLQGAGFEAVLEQDVVGFMWHKWTVLSALASITCLMRGSIGEVAAAPGGLATANGILDESIAIATAHGQRAPEPFLAAVRKRLTLAGSDLTASMYRDMMRGGPVEADHILGDLLRRGAEKGVAAPLLTAAYAQLGVYSGQRGA